MARLFISFSARFILGTIIAAAVYCQAGVTAGEVKEFEEYRLKAESGSAFAQYKLGMCYAYGNGVAAEAKTAVYWYQKSAEQGNEFAQEALGDCYNDGLGVEKNEVKAFRWYRVAAGSGLPSSQFKLGRCYELGKGAVKDLVKATDSYHEAARQGNRSAQGALGRCYAKGVGAPKVLSEAFAFLCLAAGSDSDAKMELAAVRGQMSSYDSAEGVKRLKEFLLEELMAVAPRISVNGSSMDSQMTEQFRKAWAARRVDEAYDRLMRDIESNKGGR